MLQQWLLDPDVTYLNHGTVGATPRRVLDLQDVIRQSIERRPSQFLLRDLAGIGVGAARSESSMLREAARAIANYIGARDQDLALVDNATTGVNAVVRSLPLAEGDEILLTDHAYGAVALVAAFVAARRGACVRTVSLPWPVRGPEQIVDAIGEAIGPRVRLVIVDHVASLSAWVFPVAEIAARCHERGVPLLVDGAHGPGAVPLDLGVLGADWYAGNLHKWAFAPRPSGFLWAAPGRQEGLHPPVISWGLNHGFPLEFDWTSTRDPSAILAAPFGIEFLRELGEDDVRRHNHALAWEAASRLTSEWGTELEIPEAMFGTMATFPLPRGLGATPDDAERLRDALLFEDRIEIELHAWRDRLWVRISGQVYNDLEDIARLGKAVRARG
jgi:isopenicillin-N epimerase